MQINHQIHSKNYDLRPESNGRIRYIILHYTEMSFDDASSRLCDPKAKVSSHYLVHKNGTVYQLVGEFYRAWHAGQSKWKNDEALNDNSIGIEIDNLGNEKYTDIQISSVIELCNFLQKKYNIPSHRILGHSDIAPHRKIDPGLFMDWSNLAKKDIGIHFSRSSNPNINPIKLSKNKIESVQTNLKSLGYDVEKNGVHDQNTNNVFRAFQLHFSPESIISIGGVEFLLYQSKNNTEDKYIWDVNSDNILNLLTQGALPRL